MCNIRWFVKLSDILWFLFILICYYKNKNIGKFDEVFILGKIKCYKILDVYIYMVIICLGI